ncbi:MAG: hypothetical protein OXG60_07235 [Chloroflexi bacterium]|nr:hypothetical protein [Chloroflexota bacterium]
MTTPIPDDKSCLLLVEGADDEAFFSQLVSRLNHPQASQLHIMTYGGKDQLSERLREYMRDPNFKHISRLGIVRDQDFNTHAFNSVLTHIRRANRRNTRKLPYPKYPRQLSIGYPQVAVLLLPSDDREGMLEDLVLDMVSEDPIMACVENYFCCLKEKQVDIQHNMDRLPKAKVRVFVNGKNVERKNSNRKEATRISLQYIFTARWWQEAFWDHVCLKQAKAFLSHLLAP